MCYTPNMAIDFKEEGQNKSLIEITNRHLEKLRKITQEYKMKGELHTLAFLLDVAEQSEGKGLSIGSKTYTPSNEMKYDG